MAKSVKSVFITLITLCLTITIYNQSCNAAASTADSSVPAAAKEKLRQEVINSAPIPADGEVEYLIGHRDILEILVYGEGSMAVGSGEASSTVTSEAGGADFIRGRGQGIEVRIDGRISLLHIGDVYIVGMTLTQAADYLKKLYSYIFKEPSLTVTLVQSNSLQYTVMGQITNPGLFHLDFPIAIVEAIAKAGGFTEWANKEITVIRKPAKETNETEAAKSFQFDYDDFLKGKNIEDNIMIKPGDIIVAH